ncbi:bifunctional methylenetetrahydrofolate dehydrogenase/methenyltetrahydrofolate cyclohydrolase FolD [Aquisalinus flavus]|uniref:Bifunctional protein FolD n=1 Tax=Aquisalinus flavus TaxID=1526572 RepID=A0A8J2V590_9PROT|nr:bifunctional methylenetetrahydrofolate dehydrogenase/methenyltetrahydrofolate cyclohydrolase FolD [Aquisalinus flavus]MBD0425228.1 bifunctional methylenetetrahydrofolate dehydrogenase/methenyltetrahydrofolate cyclohydrolase FolD [Aquisalinus flavus]UNE49111.1 bifunctional methylenetetrahydrofolate dehydrogenase/methenyltetrahydrofolate cyclohydrolase FolD [Aquisalinus flavus]GGD17707.1 bifunctional protein FolD [Aquisalinus flavus]
MSAKIIDGKAVAKSVRDDVAAGVAALEKDHGLVPGLAVVLVGEDPASQVYVRNKGIATREAGMRSIEHKLRAETSQDEVIALVRRLNGDDEVDGILVQLPLPDHIDANAVINEIDPDKDVDGLTEVNAGRLVLGKEALVPCTPQGSILLIKTVMEDMSGANAVVLGRSILVGKPLASLLLAEHCTVTTAHSRTRGVEEVCRQADILCAAVGRPEIVKGDWIKPGAVVIDIGINRVEAPEQGPNSEAKGKTRLVGDVDFDAARAVAGAITPVPGGVGPMTIACLLKNTLTAARRRRGL